MAFNSAVENVQQGREEVDNVQIQSDGRHNVLIVRVALDQIVGVIDDETREHNGSNAAVDRPPSTAQRNENLNKMKKFMLQRSNSNYGGESGEC